MGDCGSLCVLIVLNVPLSIFSVSVSFVMVIDDRTAVFGFCFSLLFKCWMVGGNWKGLIGLKIVGNWCLYYTGITGFVGSRKGDYVSCSVFSDYVNLILLLRKICRFCKWICVLYKVCFFVTFLSFLVFFVKFCRKAMLKVFKIIWLLLFWVLFTHSPGLVLYYFCNSRKRILRLVGFLVLFDTVALLSSRELEEPPKDFVTVFCINA
ncbi:hypothetical protein KFK09_016493 [Dendrobium nobile]|uniref:Uncharacterized protein n=1 Tax=Dendrobium nobile TaxID=94219 RepID=A0A8T3B041_DENNO|nr:hypothetical protein KFK09_016493 [Dendrobium nobile]